MKLTQAHVRNFRRLEDISIDFEDTETVFVGPNNSGKTSATTIFRLFLKSGDFSAHDFSVAKTAELDAFGSGGNSDPKVLPKIELDLWFSINPKLEFGRVALLLPDVEQDFDNVGIRMSLGVLDAEKLKSDYISRFAPSSGGAPTKTLSHYLSLPGSMKRHFNVAYFALDGRSEEPGAKLLKPEDGRRTLESLVSVEFVDAQRNIDDHEHSRSTQLSKVFTAFYKRNLQQAEVNEAANQIIDGNNVQLTKHYAVAFADLLRVIKHLGVPSVNDRELRVTSTLSPEMALQGNTTLTYIDEARKHELPENYNGLGFKNLIYLALQICDFHLRWMSTEKNRALSLLIFIEEPEVHLHAQAQQTFIANAWDIIRAASERHGEKDMTPQLVVTTHSSHVLDTVNFANVRYFRRSPCKGEEVNSATTLNASKVQSLRSFRPQGQSASGQIEDEQETLDFLKRYLKLTHCDLFFADAAVLVEGTVEKLLMPTLIKKTAPGLRQCYLTVLEVGGAYAHRFASLLEFLSVPYLVITDIDSVDPQNNRAACRADTAGAVTSNTSLKYFLDTSSIQDLVALKNESQQLSERRCYITFQRPSTVDGHAEGQQMHGRTFEETFAYENMPLLRGGSLSIGRDLPTDGDHEKEHRAVFEAVRSSPFKKTEFALMVASLPADWAAPAYIADGLRWLENQLQATNLLTLPEDGES